MRRPVSILAMALLLVTVAACSGASTGSDTTSTTARAAPSASTTPPGDAGTTSSTAVPPSTEPTGAPAFRAPSTADFQDLRARYEFTVIGEETPPITWLLELTRDPAAYRFVMESGPEGTAVEAIGIGDDVWVRIGDDWVVAHEAASSVPDPTSLFSIFDAEIVSGEPVGREEIAGVPTTHYRVTWRIPDPGLLGPVADQVAGIDFTAPVETTADVWATDDGAVLRWEVTVQATVEAEGTTREVGWRARFEVEAIDTGIVIEPPDIGEAAGGEVPVPEGAVSVVVSSSQSVFQVTGMTIDDVIAFYDAALPEAGFDITSRLVQPGIGGVIEASQGDAAYSIAIGPGDAQSVAIVITRL